MIEQDNSTDEDALADLNRTQLEAEELAAETVADMKLPPALEISEGFEALGSRIGQKGRESLTELRDNEQADLQFVFGVAVREMWFAAWSAAHFMRLCSERGDKSNSLLWTAQGYINLNGGFSYTLFNELANTTPAPARAKLLVGTPFTQAPTQRSLLLALGLYWFDAANALLVNQRLPEALVSWPLE